MSIKIYHSNGVIDLELKDIYTKEQLVEALDSGMPLAITLSNGNEFIIQPINVIGIEIGE